MTPTLPRIALTGAAIAMLASCGMAIRTPGASAPQTVTPAPIQTSRHAIFTSGSTLKMNAKRPR